MSWNERHIKKNVFFSNSKKPSKICYAQAVCEKLIWFFSPPEGSSVIMNTEISRSEAFEMLLLRHSSNSLLPFKSSRLTIGLASIFCCGQRLRFVATPRILQAHFHASEAGRLSLRRTIHLNTANYSPCTVTLQMTAESPNSKLAFYCLWIIICSRASCIHGKCGVSKQGIKT